MRLAGKVAVVTGGGRGIGRAIALALAREGADVVVSARTQSEIDAVAEEVRALGRKALAVRADATLAHDVEQLVAQTLSELGQIDILVNNAGGVISTEEYPPTRPSDIVWEVWKMDEAIWDRLISLNLKSVFLCTKMVLPHMIERKQGDIVNISSRVARGPYLREAAYAAAKRAVLSLTETTALQVRPYGIRVNAVSPGMVDTPGQRKLLSELLPEDQFPPMMSAESVAAAVIYLLVDAPREMTGQSLDLFSAG